MQLCSVWKGERLVMNANQYSALVLMSAMLVAVPAGPALSQSQQLAFDAPTRIDNIEVVCSGVGSTARADPRWAAYPLKVEIAGTDGQYLGNVALVIEREGARVLNLHCAGPWILARLTPGAYTVTATFEGANASGNVNVSAGGQARLTLRFPGAGGTVSPEYVPKPG